MQATITIRDLLWLTLVVATVCAFVLHSHRESAKWRGVMERRDALYDQTEFLVVFLERKYGMEVEWDPDKLELRDTTGKKWEHVPLSYRTD